MGSSPLYTEQVWFGTGCSWYNHMGQRAPSDGWSGGWSHLPVSQGSIANAEDEATLGKARISWALSFLLILAAAVVDPDSPCAPAAL